MSSIKIWHKKTVVGLLLVTITLIVYWQVKNHDYINFDDEFYVIKNPQVGTGLTPESIIWAFSTNHAANWHPLTWLTHMQDADLYGLNPYGHHWTSVQIHMANVLLLFLVLIYLTGNFWASGFVAALFAIHPLNVESVAWISERKNVLSTFFWILSLWAYGRYVRSPSRVEYGILILFFMLGLMAKPMVVTLPFVLLLMDYWPLNRYASSFEENGSSAIRIFAKLTIEKSPLFFLSALSCAVTFLVQQDAGVVFSGESIPFVTRAANALVAYMTYLGKTFWPLHLAPFYPHPSTIPLWQPLLSGTAVLAISGYALYQSRRYPFLTVGWFWYMGTLVPVIGLVQVGFQAMADRYTYIPIIGIFIIIAWGVPEIIKNLNSKRYVLSTGAACVLVFLMICTWVQAGYWKDSITLFSHTINVTDNNFVAHQIVATSLEKQGKTDEAIDHLIKAVQIKPNYRDGHMKLGIMFTKKKDYANAVYHYKLSLQLDPSYAMTNYNLAQLYKETDEPELAIFYYTRALNAKPDMIVALYNLSWLLATHGAAEYRDGKRAVELAGNLNHLTNYKHPLALDALAAAYAETGQFEKAIHTARQGLKLAKQSGPIQLYAGLKDRLALYQSGESFHQTSQHGKAGSH